ncbi:MAG: Ig-like domain-containing protein [Pseudomonadota bacterium]
MALVNWTLAQVLGQLHSGRSWTGASITYSFPTAAAGMYSQGEAEGFLTVPSNQFSTFELAVMTWDDLIARNFQRVTPGTNPAATNLEFAYTTSNIEFAHAYYPTNGSAWFKTGSVVSAASVGSHSFMTLIHEMGHALGLRHMGNYNGEGDHTPSSYQDSLALSVMSYFGPEDWTEHANDIMTGDWVASDGKTYVAQTPMVNDVMAIQSIYGVSTTTRTDNTVYGFNTLVYGQESRLYDFSINVNPILTIFDSDGIDLLDLSGWNTTSTVSLVPGAYSSVNNMTQNLAIAYTATIENVVTGGGNDTLTGNDVSNRLISGAGNDSLFGGLGDDFLTGGAGSDTLNGGAGTDTAFFSGTFASYSISYNAPVGALVLTGSGETDSVTGVELFRFSDQNKTLAELLVGDTTAPVLSSSTPADNANEVPLATLLTLQFSEYLVAGSGRIIIRDASGAEVDSADIGSARVVVDGNTLTFDPYSSLRSGVSYYLEISAGALKDLAGNAFAGIAGAQSLNFTMTSAADGVAPAIVSVTPVDNAVNVAPGSNFTISFDENVRAGSGNIVFTTRTGAVAATIAVGDTSQVSFNGKVVTVNPAADLAAGTAYSVSFAAGTIVDAAGNGNPGLAGTTAYNFKTTGAAPDDFAFSAQTSGALVVGGAAALGSIETSNDKDAFRVTLVAGTSYVFNLTRTETGGLEDPYLFLFNAAFEELLNNDDGGFDHNSELSYTPTTSGTYYLAGMDFEDGVGDYTLSALQASQAAPTGALTISGNLAAGQVLTAVSTVADLNGMGAPSYQWQSSTDGANWSSIAGATGASYVVAANLAGGQLRVSLSYTDLRGTAERVDSSALSSSTADRIEGTAAADTIATGAGNDTIRGGGGNDIIDGGSGIDSALFNGARSQYTIVKTGNGATVTDNTGAEGMDSLTGIERLRFGDSGFALDTGADGLAGQSYRLYQAAFARTPDLGGVGFWMNALDQGLALSVIAAGFVDSLEYKALYGATLSNRELVTKYYTNILGRAPEQGGLDYWTSALDNKLATIPEVLAFISESAENVNLTATVIGNGFPYTPYG